ncbi:MAG: creatininase family protein [Candidatus Brocadiaceae bacterium]|nr:creatininase family protein [Candidatus Brocadiaceae bacterium]
MQWIEISSERMPEAIRQADCVCVLPIGCIERHGPHLPLGTDQFVIDAVARRAAEEEPAVVFPSYYFGQIAEARHQPGTISLPHDLLLQMLRAVLDEIGRNGFRKIIIANGHGGNSGLLGYLTMSLLQEPRDYLTYTVSPYQIGPEDRERLAAMLETQGGHGGETESSCICYLRPELVHLEDIKDPDAGRRLGRQDALEGLGSPFGWYANYPNHYAGDGRAANAEKGAFAIEAQVRRLVQAIRAVKADAATPEMQREFYERAARGGMAGR